MSSLKDIIGHGKARALPREVTFGRRGPHICQAPFIPQCKAELVCERKLTAPQQRQGGIRPVGPLVHGVSAVFFHDAPLGHHAFKHLAVASIHRASDTLQRGDGLCVPGFFGFIHGEIIAQLFIQYAVYQLAAAYIARDVFRIPEAEIRSQFRAPASAPDEQLFFFQSGAQILHQLRSVGDELLQIQRFLFYTPVRSARAPLIPRNNGKHVAQVFFPVDDTVPVADAGAPV